MTSIFLNSLENGKKRETSNRVVRCFWPRLWFRLLPCLWPRPWPASRSAPGPASVLVQPLVLLPCVYIYIVARFQHPQCAVHKKHEPNVSQSRSPERLPSTPFGLCVPLVLKKKTNPKQPQPVFPSSTIPVSSQFRRLRRYLSLLLRHLLPPPPLLLSSPPISLFGLSSPVPRSAV